MSRISETGHAKNVANFIDLLNICKSFEGRYQPSRKALELPIAEAKAKAAEALQEKLNKAIPPRITAVALKDEQFDALSKRTTRVLSAFKSSKPLPAQFRSAEVIAKLIRGGDSKPPKETDGTDANLENQKQNDYSTSRMSMDSRIENLGRLIEMLSNSGVYNPNEEDLTITSLTTYSATLKTLSEAVVVAERPEFEARKERDIALYTPDTGLVDVAYAIKDYVKGAFGNGSPEHKAVQRIKFTKPKK